MNNDSLGRPPSRLSVLSAQSTTPPDTSRPEDITNQIDNRRDDTARSRNDALALQIDRIQARRFAWRPDFDIINRDKLFVEDNTVTFDYSTGHLQQRITYSGTIANEFNLKIFPFDCHFLTIVCGSGLGTPSLAADGARISEALDINKIITHLRPSQFMEDSLSDALESRVSRQMLEWNFDVEQTSTFEFACGIRSGDVVTNETDNIFIDGAIETNDDLNTSSFDDWRMFEDSGETKYEVYSLANNDKTIKKKKQKWKLNQIVPQMKRQSSIKPQPSRASEVANGLAIRVQGFEVSLPVRRRSEWYVKKCMVIFNLILAMSWTTAVFDLESTNRFDCLGAFLLSSLAFLYVVNDSLPKLPFLTIFDEMIMAGFLNIGALYMESIIAWRFKQAFGDVSSFDISACVCICSLYILYMFYLAFKVKRGRETFMTELSYRRFRRHKQQKSKNMWKNLAENRSLFSNKLNDIHLGGKEEENDDTYDDSFKINEQIRKSVSRRHAKKAADLLNFSGLQQPIAESMSSTLRRTVYGNSYHNVLSSTFSNIQRNSPRESVLSHTPPSVAYGSGYGSDFDLSGINPDHLINKLKISASPRVLKTTGYGFQPFDQSPFVAGNQRKLPRSFSMPSASNFEGKDEGVTAESGAVARRAERKLRRPRQRRNTAPFPQRSNSFGYGGISFPNTPYSGIQKRDSFGSVRSMYYRDFSGETPRAIGGFMLDTPTTIGATPMGRYTGMKDGGHGHRMFFAGPMASPSRKQRKAAYKEMGMSTKMEEEAEEDDVDNDVNIQETKGDKNQPNIIKKKIVTNVNTVGEYAKVARDESNSTSHVATEHQSKGNKNAIQHRYSPPPTLQSPPPSDNVKKE